MSIMSWPSLIMLVLGQIPAVPVCHAVPIFMCFFTPLPPYANALILIHSIPNRDPIIRILKIRKFIVIFLKQLIVYYVNGLK